MKKIMTLAIAAIFAVSASAKKIESTAEFSTVKIDAPVHLVIEKGNGYSVNVMSRNKELKYAIKWSVKNGILRISTNDLESLEQSHGRVTVVVTTPEDVDYKIGNNMKQVPNRRR